MRTPLAVETIRLGLEPILAQQLAGLVRRDATKESAPGDHESDPYAMDLDAEIRRLESEQRQARGESDDSCDDLERRFRELEERERNR